ncbi:hypothetical protein [Paractinoplanes brasiliensis]|uniref:Uncharacterized protein n=1 Tax=Paractinoplanes brasiliensis TaxID=52695 RepID=A0A4R6JKS1_9ACTN|nr:hypothetical protein [Actinoplanes brasiliensis]TDO36903.1 hypothetical protein C8E87_0490 [Actinoplanes brasiliensis]GID30423.1 hypothetical protein Abr02nite_54060 [Actinoplanes brasiliensis]
MAGCHLIDDYLDELADRLPGDAVDELADGVYETWRHHLERGLDPAGAAHAAIAEFGAPAQIVDAFVAHAGGRRTARLLLASGPIVGVCWGSSLVAGRAWTWPVPATMAVMLAGSLLAVVGCLALAATTRHGYRRTRLGHIGAAALVVLDAVMLTILVLAAPSWAWPMTLAVPASLIRMTVTLRRMPNPRAS